MPKIQPVDPSLHPDEKTRLSNQALTILAAFEVARRELPNFTLIDYSIRYGARIFDLRKAGYDIRITSHDHKTGVVWYRYFPK